MKDHSLAGAFEESAKLFFRLAQRLLRPLALGVVNDAGADQIVTFRRQAQQPDLGRDEPAVGLLVNPFKNRRASRQSLIHFFTGQFARAPAIWLEFGTNVRWAQSGEFF